MFPAEVFMIKCTMAMWQTARILNGFILPQLFHWRYDMCTCRVWMALLHLQDYNVTDSFKKASDLFWNLHLFRLGYRLLIM